MADLKLTVNDIKTGKSYSKTVSADVFANKKIGDNVNGEDIGLSGYELAITGGSDKSGFPMYKPLKIAGRKKVFLICKDKIKRRKTRRGSLIGQDIAQINLKVVKEGSKKIGDIFENKPKQGEQEGA